MRFSGIAPSVSVAVHGVLTHVATSLMLPCFALALAFHPGHGQSGAERHSAAADGGVTATAARALSTSPSALPIAAFFTSVLSSLLFFPLLLRHLPRALTLTSSAQLISVSATVLFLLTALSRALLSPSSDDALSFLALLVGAAPLLLSSALFSARPTGRLWRDGLYSVDVFHYATALTCWVWLMAFRRLFGARSATGNRVDVL